MSSDIIDAQFHRAVDIVQSLPKGGPVQTSYEDKLRLYALYKQAMEGDISIPRPGMLDMLGRAKWDSWNKQKGVGKDEAKRLYVGSLMRILRKFADRDNARTAIEELEAFTGVQPAPPASPASSTSSYHSSQASPLESPQSPNYNPYPPPDPSLPAPDVAPEIVPPSALTSSHRSLLSLALSPGPDHTDASQAASLPGPVHLGRLSTLVEPGGSLDGYIGRKDSDHSLRQDRRPQGMASSALGFVPEHPQPHASTSRIYNPQIPIIRDYQILTPEIPNSSPYLGIHQPTPMYPPRPGSASTFSHAPLSLPQTLQQIQISLSALHERMSTLERTQAMILRRDERKRGWFWTSRDDDELDEMEEEVNRARWRSGNTATTTTTRSRRNKGSLGLRVVWWLIASIRRAMMDLSVGMVFMAIGIVLLGGGWRRTRLNLIRVLRKARRSLLEA